MPVAQPLMPHATAAWLVDNSALTFDQIAEFCGLHILEIQAIADDTAATKLTGRDPSRAGEPTQAEIGKGQKHREYSHWSIANITPKDPVTLGLTTQRELDAAVAKAAKAAGVAAPTDTRLEG